MNSVKELEAHIETLKRWLARAQIPHDVSTISNDLQRAIELHWRMTRPASLYDLGYPVRVPDFYESCVGKPPQRPATSGNGPALKRLMEEASNNA